MVRMQLLSIYLYPSRRIVSELMMMKDGDEGIENGGVVTRISRKNNSIKRSENRSINHS